MSFMELLAGMFMADAVVIGAMPVFITGMAGMLGEILEMSCAARDIM